MKEILVVVDARAPERAKEALRAAVGLGLRGDRVRVFLRRPAPPGPAAQKSLAILGELGHSVERGDDHALSRAVRAADAVEIWR